VPPGSRLVSEVINPIKADYRFVDLLKPETDVVVPLLLALEPGYRQHVQKLAALCVAHAAAAVRSTVTGDIASTRPSSLTFGGDLVARSSDYSRRSPDQSNADSLRVMLEGLMPGHSDQFLGSIDDGGCGDIAAGNVVNRALGLMQLLVRDTSHLTERRLSALRLALGVLDSNRAFDRGSEPLPAYLEAAKRLNRRGFRFIIFGHTHLARDVQLGAGRYLNTGTWADSIQFPAEILSPGNEPRFLEFVEDMRRGTLGDWVESRPTYVRLDLDGKGVVSHAELVDYRPGVPV
jgi:hypothetical protein